MLTMIKRVRGSAISFLTVILLFAGCTPAGVRAFREGQVLLDKGRPEEAVEQFKLATAAWPTNAVAWNALGLAYHQSGQYAQADIAYQRALALDRDQKAARFNLGCLMLELNKPEIARAHFTTLAIRGEATAEVLVRLGSAQLRLKDLAGADKSYVDALQLEPKNVEAMNGLGVVRVHRNRPQEAASFFTAALRESPTYRPALLNLAITTQQHLRDRTSALGFYRAYLGQNPGDTEDAAIAAVATQLQSELSAQAAGTTSRPETTSAAQTNGVAATGAAVAAVSPSPPATNPPPRVEVAVAAPKSASSTVTKPPPEAPAKTSPSATVSRTTRPPASTATTKLETVALSPEPVIRTAQEPPQPARPVATPTKAPETIEVLTPVPEAKPPKRSFLQSVNPLRLFEGEDKAVEVPNERRGAADASLEESGLSLASARYRYTSPPAPKEGNNAEARKVFSQGLQAQSQGKLSEAILAYMRAAQLDPAYFEATFNLAVAYQQAGNIPAALKTYEQALAIRPDSADARYNFAILLRDGNYLADAMAEFDALLIRQPHHVNANLALANLYAQQLRQPGRARPYFQRVLEINPRHPQASAIRYWLSANP